MSKQQRTARRDSKRQNRPSRRGATGGQGRTRLLAGAIIAVVVLVGAVALVTAAMNPASAYGARNLPDQGRAHIAPGQLHPPYNSVPPTSGWHYVNPAPWGIYDEPIDDETQVHNLEHGGIMIQYWCPEGCEDTVASLRAVAERYPSKVILAPYSKPLEQRIALTAWRWIDTFDEFDEARIVDFINRHIDQGPEKVME